MSTQTDAMKLALEKTLEMLNDNREYIEANERSEYLAMYDKAIASAEKALADQPAQQEPVAWRVKVETKLRDGSVDVGYQLRNEKLSKHDEPLYTAPQAQPKREWVGLTDEEIEQGCKESWVTEQAWQSAVWWAEDKLMEKNQ